MQNRVLKQVFRALPLVIGPLVLLAIFFFTDLSFEDQAYQAKVLKVEPDAKAIHVELESQKARTLPLKAVPAALEAKDPQALVGTNVKVYQEGILTKISRLGVVWALAIVGLTLLALVIQAQRLRMLYSCGAHHAKWWHAFRALLIGLLYGNVLPAGQVGGDPIKAFYLAKLTEGKRSHALAAVMIDRALGLAVLAALAVGAIVLGAVEISDPRLRFLIIAALSAGLLATAALLSSKLRRGLGLSAIAKFLPAKTLREKVSSALKEVSASPLVLGMAVVYSALAHLALISAVYLVALALHSPVGFGEFVAKVPVANIVASLPLAPPGGWGFGEWAYMLLFFALGAETSFMFSAIPRLAMLFVSLFGALASWHLPAKPSGDTVILEAPALKEGEASNG
ncbi:MAG: flippase-like domain-containing protein [Planctomycetes bacterium]|nr:flippase-like domain-containing protein [Planctomycetota bacterium]